jgi:hypothetical protein
MASFTVSSRGVAKREIDAGLERTANAIVEVFLASVKAAK